VGLSLSRYPRDVARGSGRRLDDKRTTACAARPLLAVITCGWVQRPIPEGGGAGYGQRREAFSSACLSWDEPCQPGPALASFLVSDPLSPVHLLSDESDALRANGHATTAELARAALEAIDDRPLR
jgi:hypothetical protein